MGPAVFACVLLTYYLVSGLHNEQISRKTGQSETQVMQKIEDLATIEKVDELLDVMGGQIFETTGNDKKKIFPGGIVHPSRPLADKNWGRRMNERQWHLQQSRISPKAFDASKRVIHNRNTISDNRHDRKACKASKLGHKIGN